MRMCKGCRTRKPHIQMKWFAGNTGEICCSPECAGRIIKASS